MEVELKLLPRKLPWLFSLAFALSIPAAGQDPKKESKSQPRGPGGVEWAVDVNQARERASAEGKFVFVEFVQEECGKCRRMQALLYPAFDFEALLIAMVPVRLELESAVAKELTQRYGIREAPAILITTAEGRLTFLMEGFQDAPDFYRQVHRDLAAYRELARRIDAQDIPNLPAKEALETGRELFERSDPQAALPRLKRAVAAPGGTPALREEAREYLAAAELDLEQPTEARQTIEKLIVTTRDADRRERAELFRAQIPLAEGKPEEALTLFHNFRKKYPKSRHLAQVNSFIERLEGQVRRP